MIIAVASTKKDQKGDISQRGGRAPFYLIFDRDGKLLESIKNPVESGGGGVGPYVAKMLADKKVTHFVAEKIGPNMQQAFEKFGIEYREMSGDTSTALARIVDKK